jgi:hypothetical protein
MIGEMATQQIRNYFSKLGRRGGASKSPAKLAAIRKNAVRAHAALKAKRASTQPAIVGNGGAVE